MEILFIILVVSASGALLLPKVLNLSKKRKFPSQGCGGCGHCAVRRPRSGPNQCEGDFE